MHARGSFWLIASLSTALLFPARSTAETIRITSGFLEFTGPYNLVGDRRGFRLFGDVFEGVSPASVAFCSGDLCSPGELAFVRHANGGLDFEGPQATLDGVFYDTVNSLSGPAFAGIGFETRGVRLPPISSTAILQAPFTMEGQFTADEGFTQETLVGSGLATMTWRSSDSGAGGQAEWFLAALRYDFFAANPIPEPTTMILAGVAGAAAALGRRRRRPR